MLVVASHGLRFPAGAVAVRPARPPPVLPRMPEPPLEVFPGGTALCAYLGAHIAPEYAPSGKLCREGVEMGAGGWGRPGGEVRGTAGAGTGCQRRPGRADRPGRTDRGLPGRGARHPRQPPAPPHPPGHRARAAARSRRGRSRARHRPRLGRCGSLDCAIKVALGHPVTQSRSRRTPGGRDRAGGAARQVMTGTAAGRGRPGKRATGHRCPALRHAWGTSSALAGYASVHEQLGGFGYGARLGRGPRVDVH
jgi:hypothetical protein